MKKTKKFPDHLRVKINSQLLIAAVAIFLVACEFEGKEVETNSIVFSYYDEMKTIPRVKYFYHGLEGDRANVVVHEYHKTGLLKTYFIKTNGEKNGIAFSFYENGQFSSQLNYKNGKLDGEALFYDREGVVIKQLEYQEGIPSNNQYDE
ncbi:MAG: hypothetical protein EA358_00160 [Flavobacteriales bacterium]|nr:MAG: hypothetical protein EA358_00160 [Flavobacteriales bacterium]